MEHIVQLIVGDWFEDGHGRHRDVVLKTNFDQRQIEEAYLKGSEILGENILGNYCIQYEDSELPAEIMTKLFNHGFSGRMLDSIYKLEDGSYGASNEDLVAIYLFVCHLGDSNFKYELVEPSRIHIGGYGVFYG